MNQLLNPFLQDYPESLDVSTSYISPNLGGLGVGLPTTCRFNALVALPSELAVNGGAGGGGRCDACQSSSRSNKRHHHQRRRRDRQQRAQTTKRRGGGGGGGGDDTGMKDSGSDGSDSHESSDSDSDSDSFNNDTYNDRNAAASSSHSTAIYAGQLLAIGTSEGVVDVIDLDTKARVRRFEDGGHVKAVEKLSWSRNTRYLLSCSRDWKLCIWDLHYTSRDMPHLLVPSSRRRQQQGHDKLASSTSAACSSRKIRPPVSALKASIMLDAPLLAAEFHPRSSRIVLVTTATGQVGLVFFGARHTRSRYASAHENKTGGDPEVVWLHDEPQRGAEQDSEREEEAQDGTADNQDDNRKRKRSSDMPPQEQETVSFTCAAFHPNGERIYVGTETGSILVFSIRSRKIVARHQVATAQLKQLVFDRLGRQLVVNSSDRAIRVIAVSPPAPEGVQSESEASLSPLHRFQDQISRTTWNAVGFSGDGEYVFGGAGTREAHLIYVWDAPSGVLVKVLEGTNKDPLVDCDWCPTRPLVASLTSSGTLNLFQTHAAENWSAFAPGFEELEENREYEEKEAEFDIEDENDAQRRQEQEEERDVEVFLDRLTRQRPVQLPLPAPGRRAARGSETNPKLNGLHRSVKEAATAMDIDSPLAQVDQTSGDVNDAHCTCDWATLYPDQDLWPGYFPHVDLEEMDAENAEQQRES